MAVDTAPLSAATPEAGASSARKPLYEASTQFKNWRFSPEQLIQARENMNVVAVDAIRKTFETDALGSSANVSFLDAQDELLLVKLYVSKISQLCGHFRFPEEVEATAVSYLKRFYLKNTVMDWHPKNVMLTALFLATKTTNHPISLETYTSAIPRTAPNDVLDLEFLVAQSLNFEFAVWHTHRALWGIWLDAQNLPDAPPVSQEIYDAALKHAQAARLTDAELIYTPSQIALACLSMSSPELAAEWLASKGAEGMAGVIEDIKTMIKRDGGIPSVDAVREVDRRLKLCKNPEKDPNSKAYQAKLAREKEQEDEKRNRKAEDARKAQTEEELFGSSLANAGDEDGGLDDDDDD